MKKHLKWILMLVGAVGGWFYWRFVGCTTGSCPIQQNWMLTILWGSTMGYLIGDLFNPSKKETTQTKENREKPETINNQNKGE